MLGLRASAVGLHPPTRFPPQVEALAQLRCIDGLSAAPVVSLAADYARALDEAGRLEGPQLTQLARVMNSVAVVAGGWGQCLGGACLAQAAGRQQTRLRWC